MNANQIILQALFFLDLSGCVNQYTLRTRREIVEQSGLSPIVVRQINIRYNKSGNFNYNPEDFIAMRVNGLTVRDVADCVAQGEMITDHYSQPVYSAFGLSVYCMNGGSLEYAAEIGEILAKYTVPMCEAYDSKYYGYSIAKESNGSYLHYALTHHFPPSHAQILADIVEKEMIKRSEIGVEQENNDPCTIREAKYKLLDTLSYITPENLFTITGSTQGIDFPAVFETVLRVSQYPADDEYARYIRMLLDNGIILDADTKRNAGHEEGRAVREKNTFSLDTVSMMYGNMMYGNHDSAELVQEILASYAGETYATVEPAIELRIQAKDSLDEKMQRVDSVIEALERIPDHIQRYMNTAGVVSVIISSAVTDQPEVRYWRGKNTNNGIKYDIVFGVYEPKLKKAVTSIRDYTDGGHYDYRKTALHEFGHAYDDVVGHALYKKDISNAYIWTRTEQCSQLYDDPQNPIENSQLFADGFAEYYLSFESRYTLFHLCPSLARMIGETAKMIRE